MRQQLDAWQLGFPSTLLGPIKAYFATLVRPNKVFGSLGNVILPPICIASLLPPPPCNEEINSYNSLSLKNFRSEII